LALHFLMDSLMWNIIWAVVWTSMILDLIYRSFRMG
jgi:hypothetical protein